MYPKEKNIIPPDSDDLHIQAMDTSVTTLLRTLNKRIALREDNEFSQAVLRLVMVLCACIYFLTPYFRSHIDTQTLSTIYFFSGLSLFVCVLLMVSAVMYLASSDSRRVIAIIHDAVFISLALFLGQAYTAPFAVLYLWITVGNGFRYGVHYLFISLFASLIGFACVFFISDYWRNQVLITLTVFAMLIMIPPYVALLLQSLQRANKKIKLQAIHDPLIPIYNRRGFKDAFYKSIRRDDNDEFHHTLLFCDLDGFKKVNDIARHAAGDRMLIEIGRLLKEQVREGDTVARLGGDEFGLLLKSCPLKKGELIASLICESVSQYVLIWDEVELKVGISVGVVGIDQNDQDFNRVLKFADMACYTAKNAGGNQSYVFEEPLSQIDSNIFLPNQS